MKLDPKTKLFIEFFESQGMKFVDAETGERITTKEEDESDCEHL